MSADYLIKQETIIPKKSNDAFHIAFAVDKRFMRPAGVTIFSILQNNPSTQIHFHIFTSDEADADLRKLQAFQSFNCGITIHYLNMDRFSRLPTVGHISIATYYRIVIPEALKHVTDKVLYLDADILCLADISYLNELDISGSIVAAVHDEYIEPGHLKDIGFPLSDLYFNAGVLLINISRWISNQISEKFMNMITVRKYMFLDQDVLNLLLVGRKTILPKKYNTFAVFDHDCITGTIFLHWSSTPKPWTIMHLNNGLYLEYYSKSPWKDVPLDVPVSDRQCRLYAKELWGNNRYADSIYWYVSYLARKFTKNRISKS